MLIENIKPILAGVASILVALVALIGGSYSGGVISSVVNNDNVLGAISGPDIFTPYLNFNGVVHEYRSLAFNEGTTTLCSIKSPSATSTLESASVAVTTATTSAIAIEMAKATTFNATTTRISYVENPASGTPVLTAFVASTTGKYGAIGQYHTADEQDLVFKPNTYLNVKYGSGAVGTHGLRGSCKAEFIVN